MTTQAVMVAEHIAAPAPFGVDATASGSSSCTLTTTVADDTILVILTNRAQGSPTPTVSSSHLTWTQRSYAQESTGPNGAVVSMWSAKATGLLSAEVISVSWVGDVGAPSILAIGISSAHNAAPFDTNGSLPANQASGSSGTPSLFASTTNTNTMLISTTYDPVGDGNNTTASGWTAIENDIIRVTQYKIVSAAQSSASFAPANTGNSREWVIIGDAIVKGP